MKFMFGVDYSTDAQMAKLKKERNSWWRYCWNRLWLGKHYACLQGLAANAQTVRDGTADYRRLVCDTCATLISLEEPIEIGPDPSTPTKGCGVCSECAASGDDPERCTGGLSNSQGR